MTDPDEQKPPTESQLLEVMFELLKASGATDVQENVPLGDGRRADLVVSGNPDQIFEVRNVTPQTNRRLEDVVAQMTAYRDALVAKTGRPPADMVLVTPGVLGAGQSEYLAAHGIQVVDGPWLWEQTDAVRGEVDYTHYGSELFKRLAAKAYRGTTPEDVGPVGQRTREDELIDQLKAIKPGEDDWRSYQRLCLDILDHLFRPPLNRGLWENPDTFGFNRRDIILPNYATEGFWRFLRQDYRADHIVVDAKNYKGDIGKNQVITVANYLTKYGTGLFALIITRKGANEGARHTLRDQWVQHQKLMIVLTDDDIIQMLTSKKAGDAEQPPEQVIQQKIEDFRLGF